MIVIWYWIGTTKIKNLNNNIGSIAVKLTHEDVKEIAAAIPSEEVKGEREETFLSRYCYKFVNTPKKV